MKNVKKHIKNKIITLEQLYSILPVLASDKLVFTNGCFDLIHRGHIEYLMEAAGLGDYLIVGLNSDDSVRRLKGDNRPIIDEYSRALMLVAFSFVDFVIIFDEDTPMNLLKAIKPNILVKGGDYTIKKVVGHDFVKSYNGIVRTLKLVEGYSTTDIINKIKKL